MAQPSPQACSGFESGHQSNEHLDSEGEKIQTAHQHPVSIEPSLFAEVAAKRTAGTSSAMSTRVCVCSYLAILCVWMSVVLNECLVGDFFTRLA